MIHGPDLTRHLNAPKRRSRFTHPPPTVAMPYMAGLTDSTQRSRPLLSGAGRELHLVSFKSDEALVRGHKWQRDSRSKCLSRCRKTFSCVGAPECPQVPFSFIRPSADSAMPSLAGLAESATAADPCLKYGSTGPRTEWLAGSPLDFRKTSLNLWWAPKRPDSCCQSSDATALQCPQLLGWQILQNSINSLSAN